MRYYTQRLIHNTNCTFSFEVISPKPVITDRELLLHYTINENCLKHVFIF